MRKKYALRTGLAVLAALATSAFLPVHAAAAPVDKPVCKGIGNGDLCIEKTPTGKPGEIHVWYVKKKGPQVTAYLAWQNLKGGKPDGKIFGSTPVPMVAGKTYSQKWPTYIGPGCTQGLIQETAPKKQLIRGPVSCG
ncbi:hypothetical protein [Amycolatopsis anabasis]|uniref:hypothetical protein n=1 Tax=Amycolatopsis anabasis TaxID=1840409 RepID=UPI00131D6EBA|nr:hypothetical protein [Amycolatopsis anabasis]